MKKIFLFAALAAAVSMTSCSNDDDIAGDTSSASSIAQNNAIKFTTAKEGVTTRASYGEAITSLDQFYVSARTSENATYFQNVSFKAGSNGVFSSDYTYYWPTSGVLNFCAVNVPATWGTSTTVSTSPALTFSDLDNKTDIVVAVSNKAAKATTIPLAFGHVTAAVGFSVQGDHDYDDCKFVVKDFRVMAANKGTYNVDMSSSTAGKWSNISGSEKRVYSEDGWFPYEITETGAGEFFPGEQFYFIPGSSIDVEVEYEVYKNGVKVLDCTGDDCRDVVINIPASSLGKVTIYDIIMTADLDTPIQFTSTVSAWGSVSETVGGNL